MLLGAGPAQLLARAAGRGPGRLGSKGGGTGTGFATGGKAREPQERGGKRGGGETRKTPWGLRKPALRVQLAVISTTLLKFSLKPSRPGRLHIWGIVPCAPPSGRPGVGAPQPRLSTAPSPDRRRPWSGVGIRPRQRVVAASQGRTLLKPRNRSLPRREGAESRAGRQSGDDPRPPPPGGASPAWRGDLAAGKAGPTRGPSVSSQRLNRDGIYLANKFNDQFVLVTVALPQINYSKFKYNHWLILTHSGHSEQFIPPSERPPAPLRHTGGREALPPGGPGSQDPEPGPLSRVPRGTKHCFQTSPAWPSGGQAALRPWSLSAPGGLPAVHPRGSALRTLLPPTARPRPRRTLPFGTPAGPCSSRAPLWAQVLFTVVGGGVVLSSRRGSLSPGCVRKWG